MTLREALLLASALAAAACQTPGAAPMGSPLATDIRRAPMLPDESDHAVADLAAAALADDLAAAARALARIEAADTQRIEAGDAASGLVAYAHDAWNATRYPERSYRDASQRLLLRDDVPDALRNRLERTLQDDPLSLAQARNNDARKVEVARLWNRLAEPAGRAITTTALLPYHVAVSMAAYLLEIAERDPLPLQRRQALGLWKQFLRRYPDAPEREEIQGKVASAQRRWDETRHQGAHRKAEDAMDAGFPRRALFHAERGLHYAPDDESCAKLRDEAANQIAARNERLRVYLEPPRAATAALPPGTRELALAMLAPDGDPDAALASLPDGHPLIPESRFAAATRQGETGQDDAMRETLLALAEQRDSSMARHAFAVLADPVRNPYDAFDTLRRRDTWSKTLWILTGPALSLPKNDRATTLGRWVLGLPTRIQAIVGLPLRLAAVPFGPPSPASGETALQARRYLALHPAGSHSPEVSEWLENYERSRKNWLGALKVASARPDPDPTAIEALRELASSQALEVAEKEQSRGLRNAMLHNVTREFPDTEAGRRAGQLARTEVLEREPHAVQISRGFLEENPAVAGPDGLGLDPVLLDGDNSNSELHPDGVSLVGGRAIELHYIDAEGDEDAPAEKVTTQVSEARLARLVSRLEERSFSNALMDKDSPIEADAQRDLLFERTRIGLADEIDERPSAEARYSYRGLRERYGMVRTRESILPFDLVLQGSLETLTLGAFPRLRAPKRTPDAILYE